MKIPGLVGHLKSLSDKGMAVGPLLSLLLPRLGSSILDKKLHLKIALQLVKELPLGQLLLQCLFLLVHGHLSSCFGHLSFCMLSSQTPF